MVYILNILDLFLEKMYLIVITSTLVYVLTRKVSRPVKHIIIKFYYYIREYFRVRTAIETLQGFLYQDLDEGICPHFVYLNIKKIPTYEDLEENYFVVKTLKRLLKKEREMKVLLYDPKRKYYRKRRKKENKK